VVAALVALLGSPGAAEDQLEVYQPRHRAADELAVSVAGVLGPEAIVVPDPASGKLVIRGDRASIRQALGILQELDVPLGAYRVESTMTTLSELRRNSVWIDGWLEAGQFRVGKVRKATGDLHLRVRSVLSEGDRRFQGLVTVLEGHPAEIWLGTTYPERVRTLNEEAGRLRVYETATLVPVQTGFRVVPRALRDGRIALELSAVSAEEAPEGRVIRAGTSTHVNVVPDELTAISTLRRARSQISIDPFATLDASDRVREEVLLLRVQPLPASIP
jgi:hypothetical protein